jgi:DNA-binding MarR family transcriptional regulator
MTATAVHPESGRWVLGRDGLLRLQGDDAEAWTGLLRAHRRLTRELEAALRERHGLTLSALELLGPLAAAERRRMRIARLAEDADFSLSRASRLIDALEHRGLLQRQPCPEDSRASNVKLTAAGLRLTRQAQADHVANVQRLFCDRLTARQIAALAAAFRRLAPTES